MALHDVGAHLGHQVIDRRMIEVGAGNGGQGTPAQLHRQRVQGVERVGPGRSHQGLLAAQRIGGPGGGRRDEGVEDLGHVQVLPGPPAH